MAANTTYVEIQNNILSLISKSDATTRNRVKNWINLGQQDFVLRELWPFRETTGTLALAQGTQEYDLSTNFSDMDEQNITSVALQGTTNAKVIYWPYAQLRANQPDFDLAGTDVPRRYYLKAGQIGFWPVPNATYTAAIDYSKIPTELSNDSDVPIIPLAYRESLIHYGLAMEHDYNGDPDLAAASRNRYEQIVTLARNNLLAQPVDTDAFRILGPADSRSWTGLSQEIR